MTILYNLENKVSVVTGGTKGIGKAIVKRLLGAGSMVITTYSRDDESADRLRDEFNGDSKLVVLKLDISKRESAKYIAELIKNQYDGVVHYLVNNAGVLKQGAFQELNDEQWDLTFNTNIKGPFMLTQELLPMFANNGSIVNIVSVGGQIGGDKAPDYAATKAALLCFTKSIARIGSHSGIRVNAVAPGWIETPIFTEEALLALRQKAKEQILMKRTGMPEEVASAVMFLLSEESSYITGHCLNVNGGLYVA
jgi:3-oxoacyl-[acyl-carrier protein] reductase